MVSGAKKPANNGSSAAAPRRVIRPVFIAGGLGLAWFAAAPQGLPTEGVPAWSFGALTAAQLFTDFVGGWVLVSVVRLAVALARYGLARLRVRPQPLEAG